MAHSLGFAVVLASAATVSLLPASAQLADRTPPMRFELRLQGPPETCGAKCKLWVSASGDITADTPRDFIAFAKGRDLTGATVALDSEGGSVLGAIAFGREIRRLNLDTTVGRIVDVPGGQERPRGRFVPDADCESMCAFVLLGGVHRSVPPEARVMVHQIWLGDRREDPTAATYSAEDIALVQHDIGKLAQYTVDMGASIDLLDLSLRIPPWEPMHALTPDETRSTKLVTEEPAAPPVAATVAAAPVAKTLARPPAVNGENVSKISEQRWSMVDNAGATALARHHTLTIEGDEVGSFDLMVACGAAGDRYNVSYLEHRYNGDRVALPTDAGMVTVTVSVGLMSASLKVVSSEHLSDPDERITRAAGTVPAALIDTFAAVGNHSMLIETRIAGNLTGIRLGNTGAQANLPRLAANCLKAIDNRADLQSPKTGGLASAR